MKKIIGTLLFAALLTVSCEHQEAQLIPQRKAISFSTEPVVTKTTYSGEVQGGKEAIYWKTGDIFSVWCDEATVGEGTQKWANYRVTASSSGAATSIVAKDEEMMWGEGTHHFYAAYPMGGLTGNKLSATIPASQSVSKSGLVYSPSLSGYGFMVAAANATPDAGAVNLHFKPVFSTLEFIVSPASADVEVSAFRVERASGAPLVGDFQVTISATANPSVNVTSSSSTINVNLGSAVSVPKNQTLTISVIALPIALSNLTAVFTVGGEEISLPLNDKTTGSPITFAARKKSRIRALGILAPETEPEDNPTDFNADIDDQDVDEYDL